MSGSDRERQKLTGLDALAQRNTPRRTVEGMPFQDEGKQGSLVGVIVGGAIAIAVVLWVLLRIVSAVVLIVKIAVVVAAVLAVGAAVARVGAKRER